MEKKKKAEDNTQSPDKGDTSITIPQGWRKCYSARKKKMYFFNESTGKSVWKLSKVDPVKPRPAKSPTKLKRKHEDNESPEKSSTACLAVMDKLLLSIRKKRRQAAAEQSDKAGDPAAATCSKDSTAARQSQNECDYDSEKKQKPSVPSASRPLEKATVWKFRDGSYQALPDQKFSDIISKWGKAVVREEESMEIELEADLTASLGTYVVVDTNILMHERAFFMSLVNEPQPGVGLVQLVLPWMLLQELDGIKMCRHPKRNVDGQLGEFRRAQNAAITAINTLNKLLEAHHPRVIGQTPTQCRESAALEGAVTVETNDDKMLNCCLQWTRNHPRHSVLFLSDDKNLRNKALISQIPAFSSKTLPLFFEREANKVRGAQDNSTKQQQPAHATNSTASSKPVSNNTVPQQTHSNKTAPQSASQPLTPSSSQSSSHPSSQSSNQSVDQRSASMDYSDALTTNQSSMFDSTDLFRDSSKIQPTKDCVLSKIKSDQVIKKQNCQSSSSTSHSHAKRSCQSSGDSSHMKEAEQDLVEEIYRDLNDTLLPVMSLVLETEMSSVYEDLWRAIVFRKPPWSLHDTLLSFQKHWIAVFGMLFSRDLHAAIITLVRRCKPRVSHRNYSLHIDLLPIISNFLHVLSEFKANNKYKTIKALSEAIDRLEELRIVIKKLDKNDIQRLELELEKHRGLKKKVLGLEPSDARISAKSANRLDVVNSKSSGSGMDDPLSSQQSVILNLVPSAASTHMRMRTDTVVSGAQHSQSTQKAPTESPPQFKMLGQAVVYYQREFHARLSGGAVDAATRGEIVQALALLCANLLLFSAGYDRVLTSGVNSINSAELRHAINHFASTIKIQHWEDIGASAVTAYFENESNGPNIRSGLSELKNMISSFHEFDNLLTVKEKSDIEEFTKTYQIPGLSAQ